MWQAKQTGAQTIQGGSQIPSPVIFGDTVKFVPKNHTAKMSCQLEKSVRFVFCGGGHAAQLHSYQFAEPFCPTEM